LFKTIKNAWGIPDLRKKILFTLFVIVVFRFGAVIPVPFLNSTALRGIMNSSAVNSTALGYLDMFSGGAFSNATLFAMSVTPYINSSIIMQLLAVAIPALERMVKDGGEAGRKKMGQITRVVAVLLGLLQGLAYYFYLRNASYGGTPIVKYTQGGAGVFTAFVIILVFTAGTALMMWMGEQINQKGVGNGISILLFAGIVARMPVIIGNLGKYLNMAWTDGSANGRYFFLVPLWGLIFLALMWVIVFMNDAERRIPVQYAKRVVGRKQYGGQASHIPIKVGIGGVMPIIFASSILSIPTIIRFFIGDNKDLGSFWNGFFAAFSSTGWVYCILYVILIVAFGYFYTAIQYNPIEMANNLRQSNGTIPGIRPGKPTSDFIGKVLSKITFIGSVFLAIIAMMPIVFANATGMHNLSMGGTSIIILVGVALETVKQLESQMMMRHYKGFLD